MHRAYCQLRARRVLLQSKDVSLRTRREYGCTKYMAIYSARLVLYGTSLLCNNTLLALN